VFGLHGDFKNGKIISVALILQKKTGLLSGIDQLLESHYSIHGIKKLGAKNKLYAQFHYRSGFHLYVWFSYRSWRPDI